LLNDYGGLEFGGRVEADAKCVDSDSRLAWTDKAQAKVGCVDIIDQKRGCN
jgi:hypothetical protein